MPGVEEARSVLIHTINTYNQGVSNCDPYADAMIYACIFLTLLVLAFNDKRSFYEVFCNLAVSTWFACVLSMFFIWLFRASGSPHTMYEMPSMAIRHGCAYDSTPIRMNPLFEDKDMFARIYQQAGQNEYKAIVSAISTLRTMAIEYAATRNCTC